MLSVARYKIPAYSNVLAGSLDEGQRLLFREIENAWSQLLTAEILAAYRAGSKRKRREDATRKDRALSLQT